MSDEEEKVEAPPARNTKIDESALLNMMDDTIETLKMLDYESQFLAQKGFKPVSIPQFALPGTGEQFTYFTQLISWLLQKNGSSASFGKYDDPPTVANNIIVEVKKLGIDLDLQASNLRKGVGESACQVLHGLSTRALKQARVSFSAPSFPQEGADQEMEIFAGEDEIEIDDAAMDSDEDIGAVYDPSSAAPVKKQAAAEEEQMDHPNAPIWSQIDPSDWQLEFERVSRQLRLTADMTMDAKEWRSHIEQTRQYKNNVKKILPDTEGKLRRIADTLAKSLDRISAQEKKINQTMGDIAGDYSNSANQLGASQQRYKQINDNIGELTTQLTIITEKLDNCQKNIEDGSRTVTDTAPLQGIKNAIQTIRTEVKEMELRSGVLSHSLFQAKLREKSKAS